MAQKIQEIINNINWLLFGCVIIVSAICYWTSHFIKIASNQRKEEIKVLSELVNDVKSIREEVANLKK